MRHLVDHANSFSDKLEEISMRKLVSLTLLAAMFVMTGCPAITSLAGPEHWISNSAPSQERVIELAVDPAFAADPSFLSAIDHGVWVWNQSPALEFRRTIGSCPLHIHCLNVTRWSRNGAAAMVGWDSSLHMYGTAGLIVFDSAPWDQATLANAACHELGNAAGINDSPFAPGPCRDGYPTVWDYEMARILYAHADH